MHFDPNLRDLSMLAEHCALGRINAAVGREILFLVEMLLPDFMYLAEEWWAHLMMVCHSELNGLIQTQYCMTLEEKDDSGNQRGQCWNWL